ncbi:PepSY-associated TM helix domain-containing protein [Hyphococcus sp. DH-69]|uniref:PepSY-associated TM helix domain-containing protein n=1 Tax=Hyphococcus formosus TaxID=3143534 RepID=UPI00398AE304
MKTFRRAIFWMHLSAGVLAGLVIFMMSLTGVLLTYERQIVAAAERGLVEKIDGQRLPADEFAALAFTYGENVRVEIPSNPKAPVKIFEGRKQLLLHPVTGELLLEGNTATDKFFGKVMAFHRWFALEGEARKTGRAITGGANLLFIFLAISGLYLWLTPSLRWVLVKSKLLFNASPPTGKARDYNWHHVFSIWMLVPIIAMAMTATIFYYPWANKILFAAYGEEPQAGRGAPPTPVELPDFNMGNEPLSIEERMQRAASFNPNWKRISFPAQSAFDEPIFFSVDTGNGARYQNKFETVIAPDGALLSTDRPSDRRTAGMRARIFARYLHTGEIFGFIGQTLAGLGSIAGMFLVWTGLALSYRRLIRPALQKRRVAAQS